MKLNRIINKTFDYIRTYGFIKGLKIVFSRRKNKKKAMKEIVSLLPVVEKEILPVLNKNKTLEHQVNFTNEQKNIFFLWWDGFDNLPEIVRDCLNSVEFFYKDFKIFKIDKNNYSNYVDIDPLIVQKKEKGEITIQTFSDVLRCKFIESIGGVWIDSTILITNKFDLTYYLEKYGYVTATDGNAKNQISYEDNIGNWWIFFIGGQKGSPLFKTMSECYVYYLSNHKEKPTYFLVDIFLMLCKKHKICGSVMNNYPLINIDSDIFYLSEHLSVRATKRRKKIIDNTVISKLNWRIDVGKIGKKSLYNYAKGKSC